MVDFALIKNTSDPRLETLREIYETSFPAEERRSWQSILSLIANNPSYSLMAINKLGEDSPIGLLSWWSLKDGEVIYIEHFAIDKSQRSNGFGGMSLQAFLWGKRGLTVVLEVEPSNISEMAARRIDFYNRHGFSSYDEYEYIQPPYGEGLPEVRLILMATSTISPEYIDQLLKKNVYGCL